MKQPKRLTYTQKRMLDKMGYDPDLYMCVAESNDEIRVWNKEKETVETILKSTTPLKS